jgi:hypothetical protein
MKDDDELPPILYTEDLSLTDKREKILLLMRQRLKSAFSQGFVVGLLLGMTTTAILLFRRKI